MSNFDDGGPAYPNISRDMVEGERFRFDRGLSLRDYFAGQALSGMGMWCPDHGVTENKATVRAEWAYRQADEMLKMRTPDERIA